MSPSIAIKLRFACVGVAVAGLYIALYALFLWLGIAQIVANAVAFLLAVTFQYSAQAGFTFRTSVADTRQFGRFIAMIGCGLITSALITGWIAPSLNIAPVIAAGIVTLVLPVQNYLIMSRWVFKTAQDHLETST